MSKDYSIECRICYNEIDELIYNTICCHTFHKKCIESWLKESTTKTCPVCKKCLKVEQVCKSDGTYQSYEQYVEYKQKYKIFKLPINKNNKKTSENECKYLNELKFYDIPETSESNSSSYSEEYKILSDSYSSEQALDT